MAIAVEFKNRKMGPPNLTVFLFVYLKLALLMIVGTFSIPHRQPPLPQTDT